MKYLFIIATLVLSFTDLKADEGAPVESSQVEETSEVTDRRELAGQKDFKKDYVASVIDERAAEKLRREEDRKNHEKYLRMIDRSR